MNFAWCVLGWLFKVPVRKWPAAPRFCTLCSCRNMITRSEGKQTLTCRGIKQKYLVTNWITLALSVKMKIDHRDYDGSQEVKPTVGILPIVLPFSPTFFLSWLKKSANSIEPLFFQTRWPVHRRATLTQMDWTFVLQENLEYFGKFSFFCIKVLRRK